MSENKNVVDPANNMATDEQKERKMSRAEKRQMERVGKEAAVKLERMLEMFLDFFTEADDPEGEEVVAKFNKLDAQWRTYCLAKQLVPGVYSALRKYMETVIKEYQASIRGENDPEADIKKNKEAMEAEEAAKNKEQAGGDLENPVQLEESVLKGDGITDDAPAIQALADEGLVILPSGKKLEE